METGLSGQHTTECPWMCKCSGDKVFCDNLKIYLWPYDNTKIYRGYRFLDVPGNKIERLPGRSLKTNFPNLQQIDITGTNIPCQYVYCPKLNAVKVLSECKPGERVGVSLVKGQLGLVPEKTEIKGYASLDVGPFCEKMMVCHNTCKFTSCQQILWQGTKNLQQRSAEIDFQISNLCQS